MRDRLDIQIHKPTRSLRTIDLAILIYNVYKGAANKNVGFEDANETLDSLCNHLNKEFPIDVSLLESALWSCNLLDEEKQFWHPKELTFQQFVTKLFPKDSFNRIYNMLEEKNGHHGR